MKMHQTGDFLEELDDYFSRLWLTESEIREFQVEPLDKMEDVKAFQCDQAVRELLNEGFEK